MKLVKYFFVLLILLFSSLAWAEPVTLEWDPNSETNLAGYKIYYKVGSSGEPYNGIGAAEGDSPVDVGNVTTYILHGLTDGLTYFVVTAYDTEDHESDYSNEVSTQVGPEVPDTTPPEAAFNLTVIVPSLFVWAGSDTTPADRDGTTVANYTYIFDEEVISSGYITEIYIYVADASGGVLDFAIFRNVSGSSYSDDHVVLGLSIANGLNIFRHIDGDFDANDLPVDAGEYIGFYITSDGNIDRWQSGGPGPGYMYDSGDQISITPNITTFTTSNNVGYELQIRIKIEESLQ